MFRHAVTTVAGLLLACAQAHAQQLTLDVEAVRVSAVADAWVGVSFRNTYASPVVTCTYNLPSNTDAPAVARIRNVTASGMEVRAQIWAPSGAVTPSSVHCLVVDEGVRTLPGGQVLEARRVVSDRTTGWSTNWNVADYENVTSVFTQTFSNLVVLGSPMTANDPQPSAFTVRSSGNRGTRPTSADFLVGKHIGQITGVRATETLGVIATSPGSGSANAVGYLFGVTANSVQGVGNSPPSTTTVAGDFDTGVATQNAENGGQGSFAVLYGSDPLLPNRLDLAVDEETFAGDTSRGHLPEEVGFALFRNNQTADVRTGKSLTDATAYALPDSDVEYELSVENRGSAPAEEVFLVDAVPADLVLWTGDIGAPGSGPVEYAGAGTGLSLAPGDVAFATSAPTNFGDCTATANGGFDLSVTHLCIRPSGALNATSLQGTAPVATFRFRMRIR